MAGRSKPDLRESHAISKLLPRGVASASLTCNPNRGFYERLGGRQAATEPIVLGGTEIGQVAYLWDDTSVLLRDLRRLAG